MTSRLLEVLGHLDSIADQLDGDLVVHDALKETTAELRELTRGVEWIASQRAEGYRLIAVDARADAQLIVTVEGEGGDEPTDCDYNEAPDSL
jgi:hypothetical protein